MARTVDDLMPEEVWQPQPELWSLGIGVLAILVQLDDASLGQLIDHRAHHLRADVIGREDLALEVGMAVLESPEIVAVREEAEEQQPRFG
jgi:hypothetical protein